MNIRRFSALLLLGAGTLFAQTTSFRYFYDDANEIFRVLDSTGTLIEYVYDAAGNITQINRSTVTPNALSIFNITPLSGSWGNTITIYGQNFSAIVGNDVVKINGLTVSILSATSSQLVILIPANATTGQITVTVNGVTVSSGPTLVYTQLPSALNEAVAAPLSVLNGVDPGSVLPTGTNEANAKLFSVSNNITLLPTGQNEAYSLFSVLNGVVPGSVPAAGANEAAFRPFSVLNGAYPGAISTTGMNEAAFWPFSVLNGAVPGSVPATGANEAPVWPFSVLNGVIPGSVIPTGSNEFDLPPFSLHNGAVGAGSNARPSTAAVNAPQASGAPGKPRALLSSGRTSPGSTLSISAAFDAASPAATVEFMINGSSFGVYAAPYQFDLTVPFTVSTLRVTAVAHAPNGATQPSDEVAVSVVPQSVGRLRGRLVDADGAPIAGTPVTLAFSGLRAEIFRFDRQPTEMPSLAGLTPAAEQTVSSLDLRNPEGVFGPNPLAAGISPDFVVRFTAALSVPEEGDYAFSLRGHEGVALRIAGQTVPDGGKIHLEKGSVPLEALAFAGAGAMEVQLMWQPPGQPMQQLPQGALWSRETGLQTLSGATGEFEFSEMPNTLGLVKVVTAGAESDALAPASEDAGVVVARKITPQANGKEQK
jgi:YD repeat-containing protein